MHTFIFILVAAVALALVLALHAPRLIARLKPATRVDLDAIQSKADQLMARSRERFGHGVFSMDGTAVITRLEQERQGCFDFIDNLTAQVEADGRDLVDAERQNIEAQQTRVREIDEQLAPLRAFEELRESHRQTTRQYTPTAGDQGGDQGGDQRRGLGLQVNEREHEYRTAGEFIVDSIRASQRGNVGSREQVDGAVERLRSHGITVEGGQLVRAAAPHNTTAEVPGLLPVSIVGPIMSNIDAARPFIQSVGAQDLSGIPGTTFNRPTVTGHVSVGKQAGEKQELPNGQFKVGSVPFTKDTYGGWANVSRQEIDWTSPAVWNALLTDFMEQYGLETEEAAAAAFVTAVTQEQELTTALGDDATLQEVLAALYGAAVQSYQGSGRMPDTIWASLDWWTKLGVLVDYLKATTAGDGGGDSTVQSFAGNLLRTPRIIVPSFPEGTLIVGVKSRTEVYEDRIGFLTAIEPKVLGVELAYGGYMASGTVKPSAFTRIVNEV